MPHELSRRNQKTAQRYVENGTKDALSALSAATKSASKSSDPAATLASLDGLISKMTGLKRKLETLHEEEMRLHRSNRARLSHLQDLHEVQSLVDVKYDEWSRTRLSRLLVDYLLREGYSESAAHLATSQGIQELVDVDAFVVCYKIERSLREEKSTQAALNWCKENSKELRKQGSMLEFELRLQQYIELVRQGHEAGGGNTDSDMDGDGMHGVTLDARAREKGEEKLVEARAHAKKYLNASGDFELLGKAAGLLAFRPWDQVKPYSVCFLPSAYLPSQNHQNNNQHWKFTGLILHRSLDPPCTPLPHYPPHLVLPPAPTPLAHRPLRRSFRPQDSSMSRGGHGTNHHASHVILGSPAHHLDVRLPHMQHRTQRTSPQRAVRAS